MAPRSAPRGTPRIRRKGRGRRWSRATPRDRDRDRHRQAERPMSGADYSYDIQDAGEPMLSWAQAQQTVRLGGAQSSERFTIANELPLNFHPSSPHTAAPLSHHAKSIKSPKKNISAVPSASASFSSVAHLQKSVDQVSAPPDAQQESYVCDEEDHEMLKLVNSKKRFSQHGVLSTAAFEEAITLLERESIKFRGMNTSFTLPVDEDAVCSVCQKGDCDNTNMILFCDMCNLAVHQECYGVPYIPEGQWHCRRCMVSPAGSARCVLCPNLEGAFKQTEDGHWAHVICAMYMPKVNFKSTQLLEPVMNIDQIEKIRWKLKCVVCKKQPDWSKDSQPEGACIQCEEKACKTAFHVTCAQKSGFYMEWKPAKEDCEGSATRPGQSSESDDVKAIAFCEKHSRLQPRKKDLKSAAGTSSRNSNANKSQQQQDRMQSLNIEPEKLSQIASQVKLRNKPVLFDLILHYWKSKRRHRNGLPLLKRPKGRNTVALRAANYEELERQRALTSSALHRLEKLRTSMEYQLRKDKTDFRRDKLVDVRQGFEVMPAKCVLDHVFDRIRAVDKDKWFAHPVTEKIAPKYFSIIHHPMDFSTMARKLDEAGAYTSFESFEADVHLIIHNCLKYNQPDTIFHKFALQFQETVKPMLDDGRRDYREYVTDRSHRSSSVFNLTKLDSDGQESGTEAKRSENDDLLSEISATADSDGRTHEIGQVNGDNSRVEENAVASTSSSSMTCSSPVNSRTIPSSPKLRKTLVSTSSPPVSQLEDSNDVDSGPARKKMRTTPADAEETNASSSRVPTPPFQQEVPGTPVRLSLATYRTGRLTAFASESEPDPPFPSEDSTDHPSDNDLDSDGPAHRLRRKRRLSNLLSPNNRREYIDYRPNDFVWVRRPGNSTFPAIIVNPLATKGVSVNGRIIPAPPQDILDSQKSLQKKFPGHLHLVSFFDAKRTWAWVQSDKLDLLGIDEQKDVARLHEPQKPGDRRNVKKAYDLAQLHMPGADRNRTPSLTNGMGVHHMTRSFIQDGSDSDNP